MADSKVGWNGRSGSAGGGKPSETYDHYRHADGSETLVNTETGEAKKADRK